MAQVSCRVAMALEKSDYVRDYVMCVFCFFTVFCDKILDPNYERRAHNFIYNTSRSPMLMQLTNESAKKKIFFAIIVG